MGEEKSDAVGSAGAWFGRKLLASPATWLGIAAGSAVGIAFAQVGPIGGAIGLGSLVALATGGLSFLIIHGIRSSYRTALERNASSGDSAQLEKENAILHQLNTADLAAEGEIFAKLREDRDRIRSKSAEISENVLAGHMALVTQSIVDTVGHRLEELADLTRRADDPLLESPHDSRTRIDEIRSELTRAYQAVADTRSRLREIGKENEPELFEDFAEVHDLSLGALTSRLEEENELSRRVEKRLRSGYRSTVVADDTEEDRSERGLESD